MGSPTPLSVPVPSFISVLRALASGVCSSEPIVYSASSEHPNPELGYDPGHIGAPRAGAAGVSAIEIEQAEFFRALSAQQLARAKALVNEKRFERGNILYFEGSDADRLWVVREGEVRLYKSSARGDILTLDVLGPGEVFGVLSTLEQETHPASAEAVKRGSAWWLPRPYFLKVLDENPRISLEILEVVSRRLRDAQERLRSFAQDSAPVRVARALLHAAADGEAHVTRRALAEAAGTSVETAIRALRHFEREGLVRGEVGCLHVVDEPGLRRIAGKT
jgi:CRP-like cAMP-binding protein